ncbi:MAG: carboxypeptidase regulatory-like domain-containing protein [Candidatus Omnitrophica bacterium]|nr:carboxypeptidase regulatory-like domain-containing protein [Candidatus Omnitrophota bacterium]
MNRRTLTRNRCSWIGSLLFLIVCIGLIGITGCGRPKEGELSGVVQLAKAVNSEGILIYIPGTEFRAFTDENGSFLLTGITPGEYTLVGQYEGYDEVRETILVQAGQRTSIGPLILNPIYTPAGAVSGFITLEGETNHEDILVILVGTTYTTSTNTTGYFEFSNIPLGVYQLLALKDDWIPASKNNIQVTNGQETQVSKIILRPIQPEPTPTPPPPVLGDRILQGAAFLEDETNHIGIRVSLVDMPEKFAITGASGTFRLTGLDDKPHSLLLSHEGYLDETIMDAAPVDAESTDSCGFVTLQKKFQPAQLGVLQGRVYLEGQTQHDNITVQLQGISPPVYTDPQGRYKFVGIPADQYVLIAERPGYEAGRLEDIEIKANQVVLAPDLTLSPAQDQDQEGTGGIVGLALLEGEVDQGGIVVAIEGTSLTTVTGADGQFQFTEVPTGAYTLIYTHAGFKNHYLDGVPVENNKNTALEPVILAKDVEPPYVIENFPPDGARKIPIDQFIDLIVRFSERMDGNSVKQSVIIEPPVEYDAFFDRESDLSDMDTLHIRLYHEPPMPLQFNTTYQIVITPQARTPKGVPMEEPHIFTFTTDGPLILDSIPRKGELQFPIHLYRKIMLITNAPVDPIGFERSLRIRPEPDSQPTFQYIPAGLGMQILVEVNLKANTRYRVQIDNSMRTVDRQRFGNTPYSLSFRTVYDPNFDKFFPPNNSPSSRRRR